MNVNGCLEKKNLEKCESNYKKGYKYEEPLNYFEKPLNYEFENSIKVNILETILRKAIGKNLIEIYSFSMEFQKELSWIDKIQKVTILST